MARVFEFEPFRLDEAERTLHWGGRSVSLTPKTFDVLLVLLTNAKRLVDKNTLLQTVWGDVHVEDAVLARAISDLRKALGQTDSQVWIETVPKFGYRFVAEVRVIGPQQEPVPASRWRRWVWPAAALVACGLLVMMIGWGTSPFSQNIHSLAILPFQAVGAAGDQAVLRVGLADALITRLSRLDGLAVRPLSTVRRFERDPGDPIQAGQELRADAVLEGTLQLADGSARASIRLIRTLTGCSSWKIHWPNRWSPKSRYCSTRSSAATSLPARLRRTVKLTACTSTAGTNGASGRTKGLKRGRNFSAKRSIAIPLMGAPMLAWRIAICFLVFSPTIPR